VASTTRVSQVVVWREEADGVGRILLEVLLPLEPGTPASGSSVAGM